MFRLYCFVSLGIAIAALFADQWPKLVYLNTTDSVPRGLYIKTLSQEIKTGSMVISEVPEAIKPLPVIRGYLHPSRPLQKRVAALHGDLVCRTKNTILINGKVKAEAKSFDKEGRALPAWEGCRRLKHQEFFLLADHRDSFDSRYFGAVTKQDIHSVVTKIWGPKEKRTTHSMFAKNSTYSLQNRSKIQRGEYMTIAISLLVCSALFFLAHRLFFLTSKNNLLSDGALEVVKSFLQPSETEFLEVLREGTKGRYIIAIKPGLSSLLQVKPERKALQKKASHDFLLSGYTDFVLLDIESLNPVVAIELNDISSFDESTQRKRDQEITERFKSAKLPLEWVMVNDDFEDAVSAILLRAELSNTNRFSQLNIV